MYLTTYGLLSKPIRNFGVEGPGAGQFCDGAAAARDFANQIIDRKNNKYYNKTLFGFGANDTRYNCVGIKNPLYGLV